MECRLGLWIKKGMTVAKGTYNGQINDNFDRHGIGRWISHNGWNIYEGEYKNDEQCGYGRQIKWDKSFYIGYWKDGKRHGQGTETNKFGKEYTGIWENDRLENLDIDNIKVAHPMGKEQDLHDMSNS